MCGYVGFYTKSLVSKDNILNDLKKMSFSLSHRGPDGEGFWVDENINLAFAHRRLSVIDLTENGAQPMSSFLGRYKVVFNGEIYNYQVIRSEIEKEVSIEWMGDSDTEVILAAFEIWGIKKSLEKFTGMFSFALWDLKEKVLHLARDRAGEKPLYYGWCGERFIFASELKSFKAFSGFNNPLNMTAVELFLKYSYIPYPHSIYQDIFKLKPGSILSLSIKDLENKRFSSVVSYWNLEDYIFQKETLKSEQEAIDHLDFLLSQSVSKQMISDVPIGAFLSGGIDSSVVTSLMQKNSHSPVKTFTIGFDQSSFNEAVHAKEIANYLKTDHTELYISETDALSVIPHLSHIYDEPFADSSQIPTYLISKLAREKVTVCLSGDGGDELFGGYNRHVMANRLNKILEKTPDIFLSSAAKIIDMIPGSFLNTISDLSSHISNKKLIKSELGEKLKKISSIFKNHNKDIYDILTSTIIDPNEVLSIQALSQIQETERIKKILNKDLTSQMMFNDFIGYLPDDILVKVDRASMNFSLETRVPLLDKDIIEFSWSLPLSMKIKKGQGKWILRKVLDKYLPGPLINRPKQGFSVPLSKWLRGDLKEWGDSLLDKKAIEKFGILNPDFVCKMWSDHLSNKCNHHHQIWNFLMLQSWLSSQNNG